MSVRWALCQRLQSHIFSCVLVKPGGKLEIRRDFIVGRASFVVRHCQYWLIYCIESLCHYFIRSSSIIESAAETNKLRFNRCDCFGRNNKSPFLIELKFTEDECEQTFSLIAFGGIRRFAFEPQRNWDQGVIGRYWRQECVDRSKLLTVAGCVQFLPSKHRFRWLNSRAENESLQMEISKIHLTTDVESNNMREHENKTATHRFDVCFRCNVTARTKIQLNYDERIRLEYARRWKCLKIGRS